VVINGGSNPPTSTNEGVNYVKNKRWRGFKRVGKVWV